jgi:hypothetical protein
VGLVAIGRSDQAKAINNGYSPMHQSVVLFRFRRDYNVVVGDSTLGIDIDVMVKHAGGQPKAEDVAKWLPAA